MRRCSPIPRVESSCAIAAGDGPRRLGDSGYTVADGSWHVGLVILSYTCAGCRIPHAPRKVHGTFAACGPSSPGTTWYSPVAADNQSGPFRSCEAATQVAVQICAPILQNLVPDLQSKIVKESESLLLRNLRLLEMRNSLNVQLWEAELPTDSAYSVAFGYLPVDLSSKLMCSDTHP